jgi:hypothetical protein
VLVRNQTPTVFQNIAAFAALSLLASSMIHGAPKTAPAGEVWIAVRTDGRAGTGAKGDPYDGATATKFDELIADISKIPATDANIHLGTGTFQTNMATRAWMVRSGWHISGAGMHLTTVQGIGDVSAYHGGLAVFDNQTTSSGTTTTNNVEIGDLTIDANQPGLTMPTGSGGEYDLTVLAIRLAGSHNLVERVRSINTYGTAKNNRECFSIMLTGIPAADTADATIRFCRVEKMLGNYGTPYQISGFPATRRFMVGAKVYRNVALGVNDGRIGTSSANSGGVNAANCKYLDVFENEFEDCEGFFHFDTGTFDHVRIFNNVGKRLWCGVNVVGVTGCTNLEVRGNRASIQNRITGGGVAGFAVNGGITGLVISGNTITYDPSGAGRNQFFPIYAGSAEIVDARVEENTFSDGSDAVTGHFRSSIFRSNRTEKGGTPTFLQHGDQTLRQ